MNTIDTLKLDKPKYFLKLDTRRKENFLDAVNYAVSCRHTVSNVISRIPTCLP